ncbi:hypothetical protein V1504DRAFT_437721 [Lipomyces starkeyi]
MSTNHSFWQDKAGVPGAIRESPVPSKVADGELVVKVQAWAVNPADAVILGEAVAGTIEVVGSVAASKFKIPDSLSFNDASVFPLCIATAAHGLFSKDYLGMPFPKVNSTSTGKSVFIWGGSSGVGSNAIQLCKAAGFEVITTCSARNFDYVKSLGADKGACIGIFKAAGQVAPACQVAHKSKQKLFVAASNGAAPECVEAKMIFASGGAVIYHETSPATFGAFLPEAWSIPARSAGQGSGLEGIQEALDILKKGVSAKKIVIEAK